VEMLIKRCLSIVVERRRGWVPKELRVRAGTLTIRY